MSTEALRHNEYYGMQETFDWLYDRSQNKATEGLDLIKIIKSKENIMLAYRNIKANKGSRTAGVDKIKIEDYKSKSEDEFISEMRWNIDNYKPDAVRRVEIPKENGKTRPLGIPTIKDRLIQQMIKQVIEPICEARFHNHSYGFRPNRLTQYAMARSQYLVNKVKKHYVVDIDIKGFFDNVNHRKLKDQLYNIGIKDKRVINLIGKMLKAPIKGIGIPTKGTPQGGILSPLLSNIVLNDLDWWISNQWETFETRHKYTSVCHRNEMLKKNSNLKEMYIVRYADDFKIFTNSITNAKLIYQGVKKYLKRNLKLEVSEEKSKITNLKKKSTEFLGFELKAVKKGNKIVAYTHVGKDRQEKIKKKFRELIKNIQKYPTVLSVSTYNAYLLGLRNYYKTATHISKDFGKIHHQIYKTLYNRLKKVGNYGFPSNPNSAYKKFNSLSYRTFKVDKVHLYVVSDIRTKNAVNFTQEICNYTEKGRSIIYKRLKPEISEEIRKLMKQLARNNTTELADNKLSKYSAQRGICSVTKQFLTAGEVRFHHKKPKCLGGTDEFENLVAIEKNIHKLIHAKNIETIKKYIELVKPNQEQIEKINSYRAKCNLFNLVI